MNSHEASKGKEAGVSSKGFIVHARKQQGIEKNERGEEERGNSYQAVAPFTVQPSKTHRTFDLVPSIHLTGFVDVASFLGGKRQPV